tara:strand:- start:132728 stop:133069 length:342 start_codon:yes stop_codon:yes gene_type:complete
MHEFSLVVRIADIVEAEARKRGNVHVNSLTLLVGKNCGVMREALEFSFPVAFKGTILQDAKIYIEEVESILECNRCSTQFQYKDHCKKCPECHSEDAVFISGKEFKIKSFLIS